MLSASAYSFRQKSRLAISLSWVAGYTNVITFIVFAVVTSHATGNVTHFGLKNVSIDDFAFGVSAISSDGQESLVSSYVSPVRQATPLKRQQ